MNHNEKIIPVGVLDDNNTPVPVANLQLDFVDNVKLAILGDRCETTTTEYFAYFSGARFFTTNQLYYDAPMKIIEGTVYSVGVDIFSLGRVL